MSQEIMRERFNEKFQAKYPGMSPETLTYQDEWENWQQAYTAGAEDMLQVVLHLGVSQTRRSA